jgi:hypothetical protein
MSSISLLTRVHGKLAYSTELGRVRVGRGRARLAATFQLSKGARLALLNFLLAAIYWLVVTPVAILKRADSQSVIASWKAKGPGGWQPQVQSTSQREIFRSML